MLQSLDAIRFFTRGEPLNLRNVMQRVTLGVEQVAALLQASDYGCYGQIEKRQTRQFAQMCYLGTLEDPEPEIISKLLEYLITIAGEWESLGVVADLPEISPLFEGFRKAGFTIWARQKVYNLSTSEIKKNDGELKWRTWTPNDFSAMYALYKEVIPCVVQSIEPLPRSSMPGLVAYQLNGSLAAYADLVYGPKGIWVQLTASPEAPANGFAESLTQAIPDIYGRPLYISVRSYLPWVESSIEDSGYIHQESQVLLVKHLTLRRQLERSNVKKIFEQSGMEGSLPITNK